MFHKLRKFWKLFGNYRSIIDRTRLKGGYTNQTFIVDRFQTWRKIEIGRRNGNETESRKFGPMFENFVRKSFAEKHGRKRSNLGTEIGRRVDSVEAEIFESV